LLSMAMAEIYFFLWGKLFLSSFYLGLKLRREKKYEEIPSKRIIIYV
jgi:hypothetical protein